MQRAQPPQVWEREDIALDEDLHRGVFAEVLLQAGQHVGHRRVAGQQSVDGGVDARAEHDLQNEAERQAAAQQQHAQGMGNGHFENERASLLQHGLLQRRPSSELIT